MMTFTEVHRVHRDARTKTNAIRSRPAHLRVALSTWHGEDLGQSEDVLMGVAAMEDSSEGGHVGQEQSTRMSESRA